MFSEGCKTQRCLTIKNNLHVYFRKDIPEDYFSVKDNESSKKHRNLTTVKCKKKVRYDKVSSTTSSREEKKCYSDKDRGKVYSEANKKKNNDEENVGISSVSEKR